MSAKGPGLARVVMLFSLVAEGVTGAALLVAPSLVCRLLLGAELTQAGIAIGRLMGVSLLALVVACWPARDAPPGTRSAMRAVFAFNLAAAAYLAWLGFAGQATGILLWAAVAEHALVSILLALPRGRSQASANIPA